MKVRESNMELLRIIAMIMIIFYHFFYHTGLLTNATGSLAVASRIIVSVLVMHVNLFILISGYYSYKSKFKISKLLSLNNSIWFYVVIFTLIGLLFLGINYNNTDLLKAFLPITFDDYWFMTNFLLLYLLSPFINKIIDNISKKQHLILLIILFIVFSILPTYSNEEFFMIGHGYSLYSFIFIYLIGAFLGKYKIDIKVKCLIPIFIGTILLNILQYYVGWHFIYVNNSLLYYLGESLANSVLDYSNPLIIIQAISFFLLFTKISIKSKFINFISSCVLGVYLIHDNEVFRGIYSNLFIFKNSLNVILIGIAFTIIIFISCTIIEIIRKQLFKFIYNLKICKKIRPKYSKYFKKIENIINA